MSAVVGLECSDRIARVTLNRPDAMNAITIELGEQLERALRSAADEADVILIRGAGGNFSVGGDFKELQRLAAEGADAMRALFDAFGAACEAIAELPVPVVAVVEGFAMAGGFELMQACDIALVAADAKLSDNHSNFGMVPGGGGSQRLPRLVGRQRALAHMLTGERISGEQAVAWGLAWRAVPAAELDREADELAARLAAKDRGSLAKIKALVNDGLAGSLATGLQNERDVIVDHLGAPGALDQFSK